MDSTKSEDCLIFYAFTPEITRFRQVFTSIANFMKKKQALDPSDRFNLIVFLDDGPNYLDHFTFDPDYILKTLKSLNKGVSRANVAGGIFIAITFIIEVYKKISEKFFRLLILVDDGAYEIPNEILPALEELIKKVKDMPFFIDTILMGSAYSDQAQKLLKLTNLCNGELYGVKTIKDLDTVLNELSEKKRVSAPSFVQQKIRMILPDNQPFYIHLADDPSNISDKATCSICFQKDDNVMVKCPSCETIAHQVCWAQWAKTSTIGISHVYRCHNCFNILKLDKNYVNGVQNGTIPTIAELNKVKKKNIVEYLHEIEAKNKPQFVQTEDPFAADIKAMLEAKRAQPETVESKKTKKKKKKANVNICPNCSKITMGDRKKCPSCGFIMF